MTLSRLEILDTKKGGHLSIEFTDSDGDLIEFVSSDGDASIKRTLSDTSIVASLSRKKQSKLNYTIK